MKTRKCTPSDGRGRLAKAKQFFDAAELVRDLADDEADVGDAVVTLYVHAGIAAADAICCVALGEHAQGESHGEAVQLLARVHPGGAELGDALPVLLSAKARAGYGAEAINAETRKRSRRAAEKLVTTARDRVT